MKLPIATVVFSCLVNSLLAQGAPDAFTERASKNSSGIEGNESSIAGRLSEDGHYIVFSSLASNLTSQGSADGRYDIFRRDLWSGAVVQVSRTAGGVDSNGTDVRPSISPDGRWVAYASTSNNLVAGTYPAGVTQIYLCDVQTMTTQLVSNWSGGPGATTNDWPDVARDGAFVAYQSRAATNSVQILRWTRSTNVSAIVTTAPGPIIAYGNGDSDRPRITADGLWVVYTTAATNLVANDRNGFLDVHLVYPDTRWTTRLSQTPQGVQANSDSSRASIDDSGNRIVFTCPSDIFTGVPLGGISQAHLLDRTTGQFSLVSVNNAGQPANMFCEGAAIARDGRRVAFLSRSTNLGSNPSIVTQAYVRDLVDGRTRQVSVSDGLVMADQTVSNVDIAGNGMWASFDSPAASLEIGDNNARSDAFVSFCGIKNLAPTNSGPGIVSVLRPTRFFERLGMYRPPVRDFCIERIGGMSCIQTYRVTVTQDFGRGVVHGIVDCNGVFTPNQQLAPMLSAVGSDIRSVDICDQGMLVAFTNPFGTYVASRPSTAVPFGPPHQIASLPALGRVRLTRVLNTSPGRARLYHTDSSMDSDSWKSLPLCEGPAFWDCTLCPETCNVLMDASAAWVEPLFPGGLTIRPGVVPSRSPQQHEIDMFLTGSAGGLGCIYHMSASESIGGRASKIYAVEGLHFRSLTAVDGRLFLLGSDNRPWEFEVVSNHSHTASVLGGTVTYAPRFPPTWMEQGGLYLFAYGTPINPPIAINGLLGTQLAVSNLVTGNLHFFAPGQYPTHQLQVLPGASITLTLQIFAASNPSFPYGGNLADVFLR